MNDGKSGTTMERARANSQARRLEIISGYEQEHDCNLGIIRDNLLNDSIALFDDITEHCRPDRALHLMVETPGGDGETALRIARACLQRSCHFTLIVADWCKSAGTYLALAADEVILGPMGDLGPVDPQLILDGSPRGAAADLVNALDAAEKAICAHESLSPLYESLTSHIGLDEIEYARNAVKRSSELIGKAVHANRRRTDVECERLTSAAIRNLIEDVTDHGATVGFDEAHNIGLNVTQLSHADGQWSALWELHLMHRAMGDVAVYESSRTAHIIRTPAEQD